MGDPMREIPIVACGQTYTLYAGNRALRLVERELGMTFMEALECLDRLDLNVITTILWAMLRKHHPEITLDEVDDIIDCNGAEWLMRVLEDALSRALRVDEATVAEARASAVATPPASLGAEDGAAGKRRRGIGTRS